MKTKIVLFLLFNLSITFAQNNLTELPYGQNESGSKAFVSPEKPTYGDKITIRFMPGEKSEVKSCDSLYLNTLQLFVEGSYKAEEYLMKKNGNEWIVDFTLDNKKVGCIAFQFASTNFRKVDCNNEQGWDILIYDKDGNPVKGANMAYADGYMTHGLIRRVQNLDKYEKGMNEELKLFPEDPINLANTWYNKLRNGEIKKVKIEVDSLYALYRNNVKVLERIYYQYDQLKDTLNRDNAYKRIIELDSNNSVALWRKRGDLFFKKADLEKLDGLYELIQKADGTNAHKTLQRDYFQNLVRAKYYERAFDFLKEWKKPDWIETIVSSYMILADCFKVNFSPNKLDLNSKIRFDDDSEKLQKMIQIAVDMTRYSINRFNKMNVSERDKEYVPSVWYNERTRFIGMANGYLGYAKFLKNDNDSAGYYYYISKKILGDDFYRFGDEAYYSMLIKRGEYARAFEEAQKALKLDSYNKNLFHQVLRVTADNPQRKKEAEEIIQGDKSSAFAERQKEIDANYFNPSREAIDFTLTDLNGKSFTLSAAKGKIVILEFWDTSCGWCLKSFEKLQPFYNKHKNDKDVIFLTINTNPSKEVNDKIDAVKKYLSEHKFNFPVLIDNENKVASSYKLNGIPQTLVIGKDGKVHYREAGYGGPTIAEDLEKIMEILSKK